MQRQRFLATGALVLLVVLAGCSAAGSLALTPAADDAVLAEQASQDLPDPALDARENALINETIQNGSATAESRDPLLENGPPVEHNGSYYNLSWEAGETTTGTMVRLGVDYNGTAPANRTVAFENLTAHDRAMLADVLPERSVSLDPGTDFHTDALYNQSARERSVLLREETAAVNFEGEAYPVDIKGTESVPLTTYNYTASLVASDSGAYAAYLRSTLLFSLSDLSQDEEAIIEEARNDTYYAEDSDDEAFESLLERFERHEPIVQDEYEGTWLVQYDGEVFVAEFIYDGFT
jgi:predicted small lipoprotein YifL